MFELLIRNSAFREKDEVLEALTAPPDPAQQQMAAMMQQMQTMLAQLEVAGKQAEVEKTQSETAENIAQAEAISARTQMDAFKTGAGIAA
jgi:hypothetical protein